MRFLWVIPFTVYETLIIQQRMNSFPWGIALKEAKKSLRERELEISEKWWGLFLKIKRAYFVLPHKDVKKNKNAQWWQKTEAIEQLLIPHTDNID